MRESIHRTIRAPEQAKAIEMGRRAGYKTGGAVHEDEAEDKKLVKRMMRKREKGEPIDKLKGGGSAKVHGKEPKERLDKKPRKAMGGPMVGNMAGIPEPAAAAAPSSMPMPVPMKKGGEAKKRARGGSANNAYHEGVRSDEMKMKEPETNVDSEAAPKRAAGGGIGHKGKRGAKTNIIIHAGGDGQQGQAQAQQAHQAGMQQGMKMGAMAVIQKLKGAGAAGGPPGAGGAPGGAPPMGPGAAGPPGAAPPMAPMRKAGGRVDDPMPKLHDTPSTIKVRAHVRRRGGACD